MKLEPAHSIVLKLGGPRKVSDLCGIHRTRVYKWSYSRELGGTGGQIPFRYAPILIAAAKQEGLALSAEDFLPSAENAAAAE